MTQKQRNCEEVVKTQLALLSIAALLAIRQPSKPRRVSLRS